ncbi:cellulose binding domain-containing protein [Phytomonospora sp. NPDC050363]|uniref:cellulose binding domain-containing protein n=1 Tax=Phytomonospora sp. NPDC050363 TaxID=3155642 RepID=UPI0033FA4E93
MRLSRRLLPPLLAGTAVALFGGLVTGIAMAADTDGLTATYRTTLLWDGGQAGVYRLVNAGDSAVDGWKLTFTLPGEAVVIGVWNGELDPAGEAYTVTPRPGDAVLEPGAVTEIGFTATAPAEVIPGDCRVNEHECAGGADPGPAAPPTTGAAAHTPPPSPHKGRASPWRW